MARNDIVVRGFENRLTFNVTMSSGFVVRLWIAKHLLLLAARLIQARIEIKEI